MYILTDELYFPPAETAGAEGIIAVGGDLSTERLLLAYQSGIFPWYSDDEPILWHCPDPRFVLFPDELYISKSMRAVLNGKQFSFTINRAFEQVIENCRLVREEAEGTWITDEMKAAYIKLHQQGYAVSAEAWNKEGELAGGLYGVHMGHVFCGESMFSKESNASKFALIQFVHHVKASGCVLIDCQVYTPHLESLGARMIPRDDYLCILQKPGI